MMRPTLDEVLAAQARIAVHVRRTPTVQWAPDGQPPVTLKLCLLTLSFTPGAIRNDLRNLIDPMIRFLPSCFLVA